MRYATGAAFRTALEQRLLMRSRETGQSLAYLRKLVAFEQLLARLVGVASGRWVLKGGLALTFRLHDRARSTVDMDLARQDDEAAANADFRAAETVALEDYFRYEVERTERLDEADVGGAVRYKVRAFLSDRRFEEFVVDVSFADPLVTPPDHLPATDLLAFADVPSVRVPVLPLPQHVAEKVHAYTRQYGENQRPSSRVKDLVDLVLLQQVERFGAGQLREALRITFEARGTHPLPTSLPSPPAAWRLPYATAATDLGLTHEIGAGHRAAAAFLDPVLGGTADEGARWNPRVGSWVS